jgi:hypothetical protein
MAGNANSGRRNTEKHFLEALKMQLASAGKDHKALRAVASALIEKAQSGDTTAISIIADRLDGKVPQAVVGDDDLDPIRVVQRLERVIVDADKAE